MISVRVNEIFNYLSSDRKKDQCKCNCQCKCKCKKVVSMSGIDSHEPRHPDDVPSSHSVCGDSCSPAESPASMATEQHGIVLRNVHSHCSDVQDLALSSCRTELTGVKSDRNVSDQVSTTANTNSIEQNNNPLHKKICDKGHAGDGNGTQQKVGQNAEEKWKVVGNTKHDHHAALTRHTVVEPEVTSQAKSRKKRNRRNRDRTASSATLDFRSTSCSAVRGDDGGCPEKRISETKSFHTSDKLTCKEKPALGIGKQLSHAKSGRPRDICSCENSAGDDGRAGTMSQELKSTSAARFCSGLCDIALDSRTVSKAAISSTILDANKIDALDSFDDLLPLTAAVRPDVDHSLPQQSAADNDEWTAVNRRCKKMMVPACGAGSKASQVDSVTNITGANTDVERNGEKPVVRDSSEKTSAKLAKKSTTQGCGRSSGHVKNPALTNGRTVDGHDSKTKMSGTLPAESDNRCCAVPLARESSALPGDDDDCRSKMEQAALMSTAQRSSVKEYSLFDNHFSRAVESVMKNDICVSSARNAFTGAAPVAVSCPAVDEALLAKAPGYRVLTASPSGGRFVCERPRKYSNDSSSSLSSVKSCEDSPSSVNGSRMLPIGNRPPRTCQYVKIADTSRNSPYHDLPPQVAVSVPSPFTDFRSTAEAVSESVNDVTPALVAGPHTVSEHYSSPNEPMTLPRISTDLNPNAPDFVFRPTSQIPLGDSQVSASSSIHPDAPVLTTTTTSSSFFIPNEMLVPAAERWGDSVTGLTDAGTLFATAAFDVSIPVLAVDASPRQWTVPNALLQESLTFG